jgi:hypothetical protein
LERRRGTGAHPQPDQSSGKAAGIEKHLFLDARGAAHDRIPMRKTTEPTNDLGVLLGILREFVIAVPARQIEAAFLIGRLSECMNGR